MTYVDDELPQLAEHAVAVVPDSVEAQHLAVHLDELSQLVVVGRRLHGLRGDRLEAALDVGVLGHLAIWHGRLHLDTLTLQEVLAAGKRKRDISCHMLAYYTQLMSSLSRKF